MCEGRCPCKELVPAVLDYVRCAGSFFTPDSSAVDEILRIDALLASYLPTAIPESEADMSSLSEVIDAVSFELRYRSELVIKLAEGTEELEVSSRGVAKELTTDGNTVRLTLGYYELADTLTLTVGETSATFDLAWYYARTSELENSSLDAVLTSMYNLGIRANNYLESLNSRPDYDTPNLELDIEFFDYVPSAQ